MKKTSDIIVKSNQYNAIAPIECYLVDFSSNCKYVVLRYGKKCRWHKVTSTENNGFVIDGVVFWTDTEALQDLAKRCECVFTPYDHENITFAKNKLTKAIVMTFEDTEVNAWLEMGA